MTKWNAVIEEFRANGGKVGGPFEGSPLLLLHTTGAKSGQERICPVMYLDDGARLIIFASKAGAPTNPDWYHNLAANPKVSVEVGTQRLDFVARVAQGEERDGIWQLWKSRWQRFADYESKTDRQIPVIILEPAS